MEDKEISKIRLIKGAAVLIGLVIIAIIVFSVISIINRPKEMEVKLNYAKENSSIPEAVINQTKTKLYNQLSIDFKDTLKDLVADIRENSERELPSSDGNELGTFIIDIQSLQKSYLAYYSYNLSTDDIVSASNDSKLVNLEYNNETILLFCLSAPEYMIFDGASCEDQSLPDSSELYLYLPSGAGKLETGESVNFSFSSNHTVTILVNNCGGKTVENNAKKAAQEWVKTYNLNPDDFTYKTQLIYSYCEV